MVYSRSGAATLLSSLMDLRPGDIMSKGANMLNIILVCVAAAHLSICLYLIGGLYGF